MKEDQRLYFRLNRAVHGLRRLADRASQRAVGASSAQIGALFLIASGDGVTQSTIASGYGQDESAVTTMLNRMEREGLVQRRRNPADGRSNLVYLSEKGARVLSDSRSHLEHFNRNLTAGFDEAEIETILRFLSHVQSLSESDLVRQT